MPLTDQEARLAGRAVPLDDPRALSTLLDALRKAGRTAALAARDLAAAVSLNNPESVMFLLESMRAAGLGDQAAALAGRAAPCVPLDDTHGVAQLLESMQPAGLADHVADSARSMALIENRVAIRWSKAANTPIRYRRGHRDPTADIVGVGDRVAAVRADLPDHHAAPAARCAVVDL
jgi:cobalamin biosynthesis Mg chelatase CobN